MRIRISIAMHKSRSSSLAHQRLLLSEQYQRGEVCQNLDACANNQIGLGLDRMLPVHSSLL